MPFPFLPLSRNAVPFSGTAEASLGDDHGQESLESTIQNENH